MHNGRSSLSLAIVIAFANTAYFSEAAERISISQTASNEFELSWDSTLGVYYRLAHTSRLGDGPSSWSTLATAFGTGSNISVIHQGNSSRRFFRLEVRSNLLEGLRFYVDTNSAARAQVNAWATSRPTDAAQIEKIASTPWARWLTGGEANVTATVSNRIRAAEQTNTIALFSIFNIPRRSCGSGSALTGEAYLNWIRAIKRGINEKRTVLILEPNSLAELDCLTSSERTERLSLIRTAASILREEPRVLLYLDGGHPHWQHTSNMVSRLMEAGVMNTHGFAVNVGNFANDNECLFYGRTISHGLGNIHFVIDSGRNGNGVPGNLDWCNPPDRALGRRTAVTSSFNLVDAFLWIKPPGESDGTCNGGPSAGTWWADYALGLAQRADY